MKRDTRPAQSAGRVRHISAATEIASALRLPASLAFRRITFRLICLGKRREPIWMEGVLEFLRNLLAREYKRAQPLLKVRHDMRT